MCVQRLWLPNCMYHLDSTIDLRMCMHVLKSKHSAVQPFSHQPAHDMCCHSCLSGGSAHPQPAHDYTTLQAYSQRQPCGMQGRFGQANIVCTTHARVDWGMPRETLYSRPSEILSQLHNAARQPFAHTTGTHTTTHTYLGDRLFLSLPPFHYHTGCSGGGGRRVQGVPLYTKETCPPCMHAHTHTHTRTSACMDT